MLISLSKAGLLLSTGVLLLYDSSHYRNIMAKGYQLGEWSITGLTGIVKGSSMDIS